jgi:hypothetical protein
MKLFWKTARKAVMLVSLVGLALVDVIIVLALYFSVS